MIDAFKRQAPPMTGENRFFALQSQRDPWRHTYQSAVVPPGWAYNDD
jgi:hypothetical protein